MDILLRSMLWKRAKSKSTGKMVISMCMAGNIEYGKRTKRQLNPHKYAYPNPSSAANILLAAPSIDQGVSSWQITDVNPTDWHGASWIIFDPSEYPDTEYAHAGPKKQAVVSNIRARMGDPLSQEDLETLLLQSPDVGRFNIILSVLEARVN